MKERPILFSAAMVRAILAGNKTQTRRAFKAKASLHFIEGNGDLSLCPYGQPGDRLWVREAWQPMVTIGSGGSITPSARFRADWIPNDAVGAPKWKPSIHLPRRLSRIDLEITAVRVERLNEISEADAEAEGAGIPLVGCDDDFCRGLYRELWEQINGAGSWAANPWVWVVEFRRVS